MGADPLTAGILAAGTLGSSLISSNAAKKAGAAGAGAAGESAQVQREGLQAYRAASEPFRFAGQQAINPYLQMLGISPVNLPNQPLFNTQGQMTGSQDRASLEAKLAELRARRAQLGGG